MKHLTKAVFEVEGSPSLNLNVEGFLGFNGMRHRIFLAEDDAHLFDFGHDADHAFWMADVSISLDIIFIDRAGKVVYIHEDALPNSRTPISSGKEVRKVIEANAGWCRDNGIVVGSKVRIETSLV